MCNSISAATHIKHSLKPGSLKHSNFTSVNTQATQNKKIHKCSPCNQHRKKHPIATPAVCRHPPRVNSRNQIRKGCRRRDHNNGDTGTAPPIQKMTRLKYQNAANNPTRT